MLEYVHSVPGRLRIQSRLFRLSAKTAARARSLLLACEGVRAVVANPGTGSVTVTYAPAVVNADVLWDVLTRDGLVPQSREPAANGETALDTFANACTRALVQALAERSAAMLVRALI